MQIKALEHLLKYEVNVHPACMISFSSPKHISALRKRLRSINPAFENFEVEGLILYPPVEERLKRVETIISIGSALSFLYPNQRTEAKQFDSFSGIILLTIN